MGQVAAHSSFPSCRRCRRFRACHLGLENLRFAYLSRLLYLSAFVCLLFVCLFGQCLNENNEAHLNGTCLGCCCCYCLRAGIGNELEEKGHLFCFVCLLFDFDCDFGFSFFLPIVAPFNYSNLFVSTLCVCALTY